MFTVYDTEKNEFTKVAEPDPSLSYTYADYLKWKFEERLELFRGRIYKLSAPNTKHHVIVRNLGVEVSIYLKGKNCQPFLAPFDVRLPVKNRKKDHEVTTVVQPDICVICDESKIDARGCCGAPDLIVEILSPGNSRKELKLKHELYDEAGVQEYWVIYPEEESVIVFLLKEDGKFEVRTPYTADDLIKSHAIPGLEVRLNDIFTK